MLFPEKDRVIYRKNPLVEVVLQLKFPKVLRIDKEILNEFQDHIKDEFPILTMQEAKNIEITLTDEGIVEKAPQTQKLHLFSSDPDNTRVITLTSDFIALTVKSYDRWEVFRDSLLKASEKLWQLYEPAFVSRVGLRYKNVINREELGIPSTPWKELLNPSFLGFLGEDIPLKDIKHYAGHFVTPFAEERGTLSAQYGLIQMPNSQEFSFLIDGDFFSEFNEENGSLENAFESAELYKSYAHKFFRGAIRDPLDIAMEPQSI